LRAASSLQERTPAGQRVGIAFVRRKGQQRVVPQLVVIVEIFIAHGQREHPLSEHLLDAMFAVILGAEVGKALGQSREDLQLRSQLARQQRTGIGRVGALIEIGHHPARKMECNLELRLSTLCHRKKPSLSWR